MAKFLSKNKEKKTSEQKLVDKKIEQERVKYHKHLLKLQRDRFFEEKEAPKDAFISLQHINKIYDNHVQAVFDFSMDIKEHEFIVLVGPSGCGKSTTLRMIAGLEDITYGDLYIRGVYSNMIQGKDRNIAMVFQSYALYPHLTVYDNMAFSLKIQHLSSQEIHDRIIKAAKILEIGDYLQRKPGQLSGGQMQRVALGRAIVRDTNLFLMDEPLSNLDAKLRVSMRSEIIKLHNQLKATTIYVTHDQTEAMTMATRIVVMNKGYVQQIGTPQEIFNHPANTFVATFIGSPAMNLIPAKLKDYSLLQMEDLTLDLDAKMSNMCRDFYINGLKEAEEKLKINEQSNTEKIELIAKLEELNKLKESNSEDNKKIVSEIAKIEKELDINEKANTEKIELIRIINSYKEFIKSNACDVIFGVRPDDIVDAREIASKVKASKEISTVVNLSELLGNQYFIHSCLGGKEIIYTAPSDELIKQNDKLNVVINMNKVHVFDNVTQKIIF